MLKQMVRFRKSAAVETQYLASLHLCLPDESWILNAFLLNLPIGVAIHFLLVAATED